MLRPSRASAVWIASLGLLVAACGSSSSGDPRTTPATTQSLPATTSSSTTATSAPTSSSVTTNGRLPHELDATFSVSLAVADVSAAEEAGFWYLTLSPAAGYGFGRVPGSAENTGVLTAAGQTLTFSDERGDGACSGKGTYRWRLSSDTLSFVLVDDACVVRVKQTTAQTYYRCPSGPDTCVARP